MIDGMSFLKLYENKACTRELSKDSAGNYTLNIPILSSNTQDPYQIILWIKNDGSHNAYDCSLSIVSSDVPNTALITDMGSIVGSLEVKKATVTFPIMQGASGDKVVSLRLSYDSI